MTYNVSSGTLNSTTPIPATAKMLKVEATVVQMAKKVAAAVGSDLLMNLAVAIEDVVCFFLCLIIV